MSVLVFDFTVLEATDGQEGLVLFQRHRDSLLAVFVDIMMPRLDGVSMTRALRAWEEANAQPPVPVVACTSEDVRKGTELYQACKESGMNDVTSKPMSRSLCAQILGRLLPSAHRGRVEAASATTAASSP
eukprot:scaffold13.g338.t1